MHHERTDTCYDCTADGSNSIPPASSSSPSAAAAAAATTATKETDAAKTAKTEDSSACVSPAKKSSAEPPDGGWGWVVVGASFMAHLIADGYGFSFGILFSELLDVFGESKGRTAWVGSLFVSVPAICGPVASAVTNRYGCRATTILGGVIASAGCLMGAFARSIGELCFTFGIVAGFGLSLVFVPAVIIVAFYFKKKRAFATGLAVAGSGIGTFVFAPLTNLLIEYYHWRGTLMITAGIFLNIVVCGALFRPLPPIGNRNLMLNDDDDDDDDDSSSKDSTSCNGNAHWLLPAAVSSARQSNMQMNGGGGGVRGRRRASIDTSLIAPRFVSRSHPEFLLCASMMHGGDVIDYVSRRHQQRPCVVQSLVLLPFREQSTKSRRTETSSLLGTPIVRRVEDRDNGGVGHGGPERREGHRLSVASCTAAATADRGTGFGSCEFEILPLNPRSQSFDSHRRRRHIGLVPSLSGVSGVYAGGRRAAERQRKSGLSNSDRCVYLRRQDIVYRGSLLKAGFFLNNGRSASCPNVFTPAETPVGFSARLRGVAKKLIGKLVSILDLSVCRSNVFNLFCLHTVLLYISYDIPYVYGPVRVTVLGISENYASLVIAIIGIFSTVGQVVMGYVGDQIWVNVLYFYNTMTSIAGLLTVLVPFVTTFLPMAFLYAGYGFFISANFALTTVILVELLGMQKLTNAFGMVSLAQGLANLVGPPLAGWLSDVTGSYDAAFYATGLTILVSGLMLFAAPYLATLDGSSPLFRMTMNDLPVYLGEEVVAGQSHSRPPSSNSLCKILIDGTAPKLDDADFECADGTGGKATDGMRGGGGGGGRDRNEVIMEEPGNDLTVAEEEEEETAYVQTDRASFISIDKQGSISGNDGRTNSNDD